MTQEIIIYILLGVALIYLGYRVFRRKKKDDCDKCG